MTAPCSATAAMSRPSRPAPRADDDIVEMMIGREYSTSSRPSPHASTTSGRPVLEVRNLSWADRPQRYLLRLRAGEVVGLGGLDGQGQRELLLALFGVLRGVYRRGCDRRKAGQARQPAPGQSCRHRHGADPGGPQDGRPDAAHVGERQPLLRRARPAVTFRHHRSARRNAGRRRDDPSAWRSAPTASAFRPTRCRAATSRRS